MLHYAFSNEFGRGKSFTTVSLVALVKKGHRKVRWRDAECPRKTDSIVISRRETTGLNSGNCGKGHSRQLSERSEREIFPFPTLNEECPEYLCV